MTITKSILDLLATSCELPAQEIANTLGANLASVKVVISRLYKQGKLKREKMPVTGMRGPKTQYFYSIA